LAPLFLSHHPATTDLYTLSLHDALPIYVSGAKQATLDYYTTYNEYTENPYSETRYEAAPNGRVTEEGAPGYDWSISIFEGYGIRSEEHTSELQSRENLVCRLLLEKKKKE